MTKIMTSIIAFDLLKNGEITLDEKFVISEKAWRLSQSGYSSMFIMLNDEISVENLLKGQPLPGVQPPLLLQHSLHQQLLKVEKNGMSFLHSGKRAF